MNKPFLSIVLTGRNDNYGGDFRERLQRCISWTFKELVLKKIKSEIIFVNYNPLPEPAIAQFIVWPKSNNLVSIRILTVSSTIHEELIKEGKVKNVPLLEYHAKNAGIRRAKGEYILCINPDIIIPSEIFEDIKSVSKECFYRVNRFDFNTIAGETNINELKKHITKAWLKDFSFAQEPGEISKLRYFEILLRQKIYFTKYNLLLVLSPIFNLIWKVKYHPKAEMKYHCNVSGDFMLMHHTHWNTLKGHNEQSFISLHTDALMVIQAATLGLKEKVLSSPIYHREHERRYDANDENQVYRQAYLFFQEQAQKMIAEKQPVIYNDENWGLNKFDLKEEIS